jgi:prepilin peptidase CpaA
VTELTDHGLPLLGWGVVIGSSLVAAVCDVRSRLIPNALTVPMLLGGLAWAAWRAGSAGLIESILACVLVAAPCLVLFAFFGGGAGDVKLMGAIGAWLGIVNGLVVLFCVSLSGTVIAAVMLFRAKRAGGLRPGASPGVGAGCATGQAVVKPSAGAAAARTMPYGVAILVGACLAALGRLLCGR